MQKICKLMHRSRFLNSPILKTSEILAFQNHKRYGTVIFILRKIKADEMSSTGYNLLIDVNDLDKTDISKL